MGQRARFNAIFAIIVPCVISNCTRDVSAMDSGAFDARDTTVDAPDATVVPDTNDVIAESDSTIESGGDASDDIVCAAGLLFCSGRCVDPATDPNNCGGCGLLCGCRVCTSGVCSSHGCGILNQCNCGGGTGCVNLWTDPNNCGGCGTSCPSGTTCVDAGCRY